MNKTMTHTLKRNELKKMKNLGAKLVTFFTAAFLILTPTVASAAELTSYGIPYGYGNGYKNVLSGKDAFQRLFKVGSSTVPVYSTSFKGSVPTDPSLRFQAVPRSKSGLANLAKAADVAARASSIGTPLSDVNSEAVAVQLAVWHFLEGTDIKPVGQINVPILQRAEELIEKASAVNTPERAVSVDLKVTQDKLADGTRVTVTLSASGMPLAGEYVTVKAGTKTIRVLTNDAGVALAKLPRFSSATALKASFNWSLPAGTVLVPPSGASVITAKVATIVSTASTKIAGNAAAGAAPKPTPAKATPTPTPTPTPTASATPTPSPTEAMLTGDFEDPAADVIDVVPEQEVTTEDDGLPGWVPLVGVAVLFLIALGIARQRLNG